MRLSKTTAVLPDEFIPWNMKEYNDLLMSGEVVSLHRHPLFDTLSPERKKEPVHHEAVQLLYSHALAEYLPALILFQTFVETNIIR